MKWRINRQLHAIGKSLKPLLTDLATDTPVMVAQHSVFWWAVKVGYWLRAQRIKGHRTLIRTRLATVEPLSIEYLRGVREIVARRCEPKLPWYTAVDVQEAQAQRDETAKMLAELDNGVAAAKARIDMNLQRSYTDAYIEVLELLEGVRRVVGHLNDAAQAVVEVVETRPIA